MYVKRNIVARSLVGLYHGNTAVFSLILLIHARPCQPFKDLCSIYCCATHIVVGNTKYT